MYIIEKLLLLYLLIYFQLSCIYIKIKIFISINDIENIFTYETSSMKIHDILKEFLTHILHIH